MLVIQARNVNDAYAQGLDLLSRVGMPQQTRAGAALVAPTPVMTVYERPQERVLIDSVRDANPFFHLFESLWMLGGRDDAEYLNQFVRNFGERYAEPDGRIHGAYGRRWRRWFAADTGPEDAGPPELDQLDECVRLLRANPDDRQCVIQMWDAAADLGVPGLRDRPCNTQIYLRVREDMTSEYDAHMMQTQLSAFLVLDLTVTCRSNDIVWGAYGANAVHFSVLQEYLAARIGVGMGRMYQLSNNWHGYDEALRRVRLDGTYTPSAMNSYVSGGARPMFTVPDGIDSDIDALLTSPETAMFRNDWFRTVARPMLLAHQYWRHGNMARAMEFAALVAAPDWRQAALAWLERRARARHES